jgi:hypothetical protein
METEPVVINATVESWATALPQGKKILIGLLTIGTQLFISLQIER